MYSMVTIVINMYYIFESRWEIDLKSSDYKKKFCNCMMTNVN